jgi:CBS domain-containing protein
VEEGPVVTSDTSSEDALKEMERFDFHWTAVVDEGELKGWVDVPSVKRVRTVSEVEPRPFSAYVTEQSTLREALDSIVTSRTHVAVVAIEGQRYKGILTLERISREILS